MTERVQFLRKFFIEEQKHRERRSSPVDLFMLAASFREQQLRKRPQHRQHRQLPDKRIHPPHLNITVRLATVSSCATSSRNIAPTLSWMMNSSENTSA